MKPAIIIFILGLIAPLAAGAQDLASLEQLRLAAEKGDADAQIEMGVLYEFGFNLPKNNVTALAWYLRAAEQGNAFALKRRDMIQSGMSPEEIEAAQKLSRELAAQKPQDKATSPAAKPAPTPADAAPASEAPLAGPPNIDNPSSAP